MSSKMLLSALAVVAAIALVGATQDPTFEYPAAKNIGFDRPQATFAPAAQSKGKVSVSFRNATVREVLDWLKNSGVSFVIGDDQVNKDSRINVNIVNQPIESLMRALASAWNGHWDRSGDMWVFHEGAGPFGVITEPLPALAAPKPEPSFNVVIPDIGAKTYKIAPKSGDGPFIWTVPDVPAPAQSEALKRALQTMPDQWPKDLNDQKAWEHFQQKWEQWAREYEKNFQDFEKDFKGQNFDYKLDQKQLDELRKEAEEMAKSAQSLRTKIREDGSGGIIVDGTAIQPFDQKRLQDLMKQSEDFAKGSSGFASPFVIAGGHQDLRGLNDSLTESQRAKMDKDGFLRYSDLTAKQKAMLGTMGGGDWTITYKSGSASFTIKSDH